MSAEFPQRRRACGFTLIEVLIALAIVALGMTAVYMQLGQFASNAIYMREKTLASWIGSNRVTELSLQAEWPEPGDFEDELQYAGEVWIVTVEITETEIEALRRADVSVALADRPDVVIHVVSGLIEPPPDASFPPVSWSNVRQGPTPVFGPGPRG